MRDPQVYVCGDVHIPYDVHKLSTKAWPEQKELTKDDLLIITGDLGLLWAKTWDAEELWWANWLANKRFTVCFVDGNHEHHIRLNMCKEVSFYGGMAGLVYKGDKGSIYHLKRGEAYNMYGKTIFTLGGAVSTDKGYRKAYVDWWPEEEVTLEDKDKAMRTLRDHNFKVDYIISHTCPSKICKLIRPDRYEIPDYSRDVLDIIDENVDFKQMHFGHMHEDIVFNGKYFCHYNAEPWRII